MKGYGLAKLLLPLRLHTSSEADKDDFEYFALSLKEIPQFLKNICFYMLFCLFVTKPATVFPVMKKYF